MDSYQSQFKEALLRMDQEAARELLRQTAEALTPVQSLESLIIPSLNDIGLAWNEGDIALSQLYMSGRICEALVDELLPHDTRIRHDLPRTAVVVLDDYHVLGKRIVYSVLRASGVDVLDYGTGHVEDTLARVKADGVRILMVSTLMLHSALHVMDLRTARDRAGLDFKIVVGGAPFRMDDRLWLEMGADAMGRSAADAFNIITQSAETLT